MNSTLLPWFALRVRSRAEVLVGKSLENRRHEIFVPTYLDIRKYQSCVKKVNAALFPGYLFCRLDISNRLVILQTPGVHHIVSVGGIPCPVEEQELSAIRLAVDSHLPAQPWPYLTAGLQARIECGPLAGLEGIVTLLKGRERLVLSVHMLQRSVAIEIDRSWIRPMGVRQPGAVMLPPPAHFQRAAG